MPSKPKPKIKTKKLWLNVYSSPSWFCGPQIYAHEMKKLALQEARVASAHCVGTFPFTYTPKK